MINSRPHPPTALVLCDFFLCISFTCFSKTWHVNLSSSMTKYTCFQQFVSSLSVMPWILATDVSEAFLLCLLPRLCFDVIHSSIWDTKQPTGYCHRPACLCVVRDTSICLSSDKLDLSRWWRTWLSFLFKWLKLMRQSVAHVCKFFVKLCNKIICRLYVLDYRVQVGPEYTFMRLKGIKQLCGTCSIWAIIRIN